jgi:hypothetical protein
MHKIKRIQNPVINVTLLYNRWGSSNLIADNYELNEYEFRQLQVDYAKGIKLEGCTLVVITYQAGDVTGEMNKDGSISVPMPTGYLDIADNNALELFKLKNKKRLEELDKEGV